MIKRKFDKKVSGNNPHNNATIVDFKNKEIYFKPVGNKNLFVYWFEYMFKIFIILTYFFVLLIAFIALLAVIIYRQTPEVPTESLYIIFIIFCVTFMLISFQYLNTKWRDNYYPKLASCRLMNFLQKPRKFNVNNESGTYTTYGGYEILLPFFTNVYLKYNFTEDYSEFIKEIKIIEIYEDYPYDWNVHFIFTQKPIKGKFGVEYI